MRCCPKASLPPTVPPFRNRPHPCRPRRQPFLHPRCVQRCLATSYRTGRAARPNKAAGVPTLVSASRHPSTPPTTGFPTPPSSLPLKAAMLRNSLGKSSNPMHMLSNWKNRGYIDLDQATGDYFKTPAYLEKHKSA